MLTCSPVTIKIGSRATGHLAFMSLETHPRFTLCADIGSCTPLTVILASSANVWISIEVEAIGTVGSTRVGALDEVVTRPARDALVAPTADTRFAHGGAFLAALSVVTEKSTGALRDAHPGVVLELEEVVKAVNTVVWSRTLTAILIAFRITGTVVFLNGLLFNRRQWVCEANLLSRVRVDRGPIQHQRPLLQLSRHFLAAELRGRVVDL